MATNVRTHVVADQIPKNPLAHLLFEGEDDDILDEWLEHSYTVLYESWVNIVKINEDLQGQVYQLTQDNRTLEKEVSTLKGKIIKNNITQFELEHFRKIVRLINSGTTSLDHILCMESTSKAREGIGY